MKKLFICLFILLPFLCLAEESDAEGRLKALEEDVDQLKRDAALSEVPELTQNLDWGKGWSWYLTSGNERHAEGVGFGFGTPRLGKSFRIDGEIFTSSGGQFPDLILNPDLYYSAMGLKAECRATWMSPLYFNLSRLYGGLAVNYSRYWGTASDGQTATDHITSDWILWHLTLGTELFFKSNRSVFLEYTPVVTSGGIPFKMTDLTFLTRTGILTSGSPELKIGVRFYLK